MAALTSSTMRIVGTMLWRHGFALEFELRAHERRDAGPWIVEALLDTGQRLHSDALDRDAAREAGDDMRARASVMVVTLIHVRTAEAIALPSLHLASRMPHATVREAVAEVCG